MAEISDYGLGHYIPKDVMDRCDSYSTVYNTRWFLNNVMSKTCKVLDNPNFNHAITEILKPLKCPKLPKVPDDPDRTRKNARLIGDVRREINLYIVDDAIIIPEAINRLQDMLYEYDQVFFEHSLSMKKFFKPGIIVPLKMRRPVGLPSSEPKITELRVLCNALADLCHEVTLLKSIETHMQYILDHWIDPKLTITDTAWNKSGVKEAIRNDTATLTPVVTARQQKLNALASQYRNLLSDTLNPALDLMQKFEDGWVELVMKREFYEKTLAPILENIRFFNNPN